jgi:hypothetical protein
MAYIDDLDAPRVRRRPVVAGVAPPVTPAPVNTYDPPADTSDNTGIRPPRVPPVAQPPVVPPVVPTGAPGGQAVPRPPTTPPQTPAPPPVPPAQTSQAPTTPQGVGQYAVQADQAKLNSGHDSPMYRMLRTLSNFDPRKGLSPEVIAALNQLGLGTFSAAGNDKLRISGNLDPRWDGVTEWDVIKDFNTGNGVWVGQGLNGKAAEDYAAAVAAQQAAGQPATSAAVPGTAGPGQTAGAGGGSSLPPGGAPGLTPISGTLGGSQGIDFGITGPYGYDDPSTQQLEEFLRLLIDDKTNPIDDPARNEYANALRQRFLSIVEPGSGVNAGATSLDQQLQDAIAQLTNPALTENDRARLENRALEPMERDRQIRLQQQKEQLAARGLGESSGIITEALAGVDRDFDRRRGEVQRDLSIYEREQQDARRRDAIGFGTQRRDVLATELDRERGRYGEALTMAEALSNLSGQQRGEQDARMREALTYISLFPEMDERRMRLAMETLGMSNGMASGQSIFSTLSNLQQQAQAAAQQGQQQNAAFWNSMGQWMANSFGTGGKR